MKKLLAAGMIASVAASQVQAHPTNIPYYSRGDCEAAYAQFSKLDRERLNEIPGVTPGDAQKTFRDLFRCQYDAQADAWFIVLVGAF